MKNWEKLFEQHILERGYDYYCEDAVENLDISADSIRACVEGTEDYEVEISLDDGEVTEMYCSCPYAGGGRNCKHMAAVLYAWAEDSGNGNSRGNDEADNRTDNEAGDMERDLFLSAHTKESYNKKVKAIEKLVESADIETVKSYLASVLAENEKMLVRFHGIVKRETEDEDVERYKEQVDRIVDCYLGRDHFISYYEADNFIRELQDVLDEDVRRMIDNGDYWCAFELMNYIFVLTGSVDMDDSGGGTGMMAEGIYELWRELLEKANAEEKRKMFQWFTAHLDGSVIDYLEEFIEQIIMEGFEEEEYTGQKMLFAEAMLEKSEKTYSGWSRNFNTGKWALRYLDMLGARKADRSEIEDFCERYWENSEVRKYFIDLCMESKEFDRALEALDESISMDKEYRGLVSGYSRKKKEIFLLKGDKEAYIGQLWELILNHEAGNPEIYRELKKQYTEEEWLKKREELFEKLPGHAHVEELYKEEKLYDRLLDFVMVSPGLYSLQKYAQVLKKDYAEEILQKYKKEVDQMASRSKKRSGYQELTAVLRTMQKVRGGSHMVETIVRDWKIQYRNRPAMMEELGKL